MALNQVSLGALHLFLGRLLARSVLSAAEQQAILSLPSQAVDLRAKRDFVYLNGHASYSCLIASGMVARFSQTVNGARQLTAIHVPGDIADLHSTVRPMGVGGLSTLCDSTIVRIPNEAIRAAATRFPGIYEALWRDSVADTAVMMEWMVSLGRRNAKAGIAHILCEMAIRSGNTRDISRSYIFPLTQEQFGEATGLTAVHVNRSLKSLRDGKLATVRLGRVVIHDWVKLAQVAEFNDGYLIADFLPISRAA